MREKPDTIINAAANLAARITGDDLKRADSATLVGLVVACIRLVNGAGEELNNRLPEGQRLDLDAPLPQLRVIDGGKGKSASCLRGPINGDL